MGQRVAAGEQAEHAAEGRTVGLVVIGIVGEEEAEEADALVTEHRVLLAHLPRGPKGGVVNGARHAFPRAVWWGGKITFLASLDTSICACQKAAGAWHTMRASTWVAATISSGLSAHDCNGPNMADSFE